MGRARPAAFGLFLVAALAASPARADWTFHGTVDGGRQSDAVVDANGVIHFVGSRYRQFDFSGTQLVSEPHGDAVQYPLGFCPAIAVSDGGIAHVLTRQGGSLNGYDITYERRRANGVWDRHYIVGDREVRNYIVSIAWAGSGQIYATYTEGLGNVWADLHMFALGPSSATYLGAFHGISRVDSSTCMRGNDGRVFLASGKCNPGGRVYALQATAGPNIFADLTASTVEHAAGTGRRTGPDVWADHVGQFHLLYGTANRLYYNRYDAQGQQLQPDVLALDGLDEVADRAGLGAIAASDDGSLVLAVGLVGDTVDSPDGRLVSALSTDGGDSFGPRTELGKRSSNWEGRQAPTLVAVGKKFFLFFVDRATSQTGLGIFTIDADDDGWEATVDCDDGDPTVHPDAVELCDNGQDDNCNGLIDEGCYAVGGYSPGGSSAGGSSAGGSSAGGASTGGSSWSGGPPGGTGGDGLTGPQAGGGAQGQGLVGGCSGCSASAATTPVAWSVLIASLVARRIRRRRRR